MVSRIAAAGPPYLPLIPLFHHRAPGRGPFSGLRSRTLRRLLNRGLAAAEHNGEGCARRFASPQLRLFQTFRAVLVGHGVTSRALTSGPPRGAASRPPPPPPATVIRPVAASLLPSPTPGAGPLFRAPGPGRFGDYRTAGRPQAARETVLQAEV